MKKLMNDTFHNNIYNIFNTTNGTQQTEISWNLPATQCQYNGYSRVHILCLQKKENCTYQMNNYRYCSIKTFQQQDIFTKKSCCLDKKL